MQKQITVDQNRKLIKEVRFEGGSVMIIEHEEDNDLETSYLFTADKNGDIIHSIHFYVNGNKCAVVSVVDSDINYLYNCIDDTTTKGYAVSWANKDDYTLWKAD